MIIKSIKNMLLVWILSTLISFLWMVSIPSDLENVFIFGLSKTRLLIAALLFVFLILQGLTLFLLQKPSMRLQTLLADFQQWLTRRDNFFSLCLATMMLFLLNLGGLLFTWLIFPTSTRPIFILGLILTVSFLFFFISTNTTLFQTKTIPSYLKFLPKFKYLSNTQKQTFYLLLLLGFIYFLLFIPVNRLNTQSLEHFFYHSGDEGVIYPILMEMFVPEDNFSSQLYRLFIYEDYHYGYPFYVISALVVLPVRLLYGVGFAEQIHINMLLLRQLVSVLPMILSALILVYLLTRFKNRFYSITLFLFILSIPGIVKYNILFWHPDSLAILFVVLTLFFLERDQFQFGPNWVTAAITCGIASSIRLIGFFAGLAVAYVLIYALVNQKIAFKKLFWAALVFLFVMCAVILLTSPYLLMSSARERFAEILAEKQHEMKFGYDDPDPQNIYRTGWQVWLPFLEMHYGNRFLLAMIAFGLGFTSFVGNKQHINRLISLWVIPALGYLIYFVAVKSYQYLLPPMVPFLAASLNLPLWLSENRKKHPKLFLFLEIIFLLGVTLQWIDWIQLNWHLYRSEF